MGHHNDYQKMTFKYYTYNWPQKLRLNMMRRNGPLKIAPQKLLPKMATKIALKNIQKNR